MRLNLRNSLFFSVSIAALLTVVLGQATAADLSWDVKERA